MTLEERFSLLEKQFGLLLEENNKLVDENKQLKTDIYTLQQSNDYMRQKLFGSKSEKTAALIDRNQLNLFNEAEIEANQSAPEPVLEDIPGYKRKKFKGQRDELVKDLPRYKQVAKLHPEDMFCEECNSPLHVVGEEFVRTEVQIIPAQIKVIDHYRQTVECRPCRAKGLPHKFKSPMPYPVIQHSLASPSTVAWVMYQKYVNAMPLYRQEKDWLNMGLKLKRATMANWVIVAANNWLEPIYERMHQYFLEEKYIHADETPIQVLNEEGRKNTTKSYMWVYSTVNSSDKPIRLLEYQPGRSGEYPQKFLEGFQGYLHTDAYAGYNKIPGIKRCMCWAHLRRKMVDALPKNVKDSNSTLPSKGIEFCNRLFKVEAQAADMLPEKRKEYRLEHSVPILNEFWAWLEFVYSSSGVLLTSKFGDAVQYAFNHKEEFMTFLEDGHCSISNNLAENSVRGVCLGRKNWLFSASPKGAKSSSIVYSMVETAKANGLNPYKYLEYIFKLIPGMNFLNDPELLEEFLPWHPDIQQNCK